jgi:hypothetical protein
MFETLLSVFRAAAFPSRRVNLCFLLGFLLFSIFDIYQVYQVTRPEMLTHIEIDLPDPLVVKAVGLLGFIFFIGILTIILGRIHIPFSILCYFLSPLYMEVFEVLDNWVYLGQPTPAAFMGAFPCVVILLLAPFWKRFRTIEVMSVASIFIALVGLVILYHISFVYPSARAYSEALNTFPEQAAYMDPENLEAFAKNEKALTILPLEGTLASYSQFLNEAGLAGEGEMSDRVSGVKDILETSPATLHSWIISADTFTDYHLMIYDGRSSDLGPRIYAFPTSFLQTQYLYVSGGFYLSVTVVVYFWTFVAFLLSYAHGKRAKKILIPDTLL